jgi:glutamate-5-semialdehyde dehydrogenase
MDIKIIAKTARNASIRLAAVTGEVKNQALANIAAMLRQKKAVILEANRADVDRAKKENLAVPLLKRLRFTGDKIEEACKGLESLMLLDDPVGVTLSAVELDDRLDLFKVSCPIGVIGVVFESRPDALVQISCLCLKSGNAVLLKGGSEASATNRVLADIISQASEQTAIPKGWLGLLETRADVDDILELDDDIDLLIPRGSNAFVRHIMKNTQIPVLGHADGICHLYVDRGADIKMALDIALDSKCQYVAVCNALETLLVHQDIAKDLLPTLKAAFDAKHVEIRGCEKTRQIIEAIPATEKDWKTEYLDLILSIKVVDDMTDAMDHINHYGSGHTDVIVTRDRARAVRFMDYVDSANVFMNCSSRFADGFRFGLGAEVGISTNKIHARGPVGLEGLMIYKWRMLGDGHVVADYAGQTAKSFTHKKLQEGFNRK